MTDVASMIEESRSWGPLPAPARYDTAPVYTRVARLTTDGTAVFIDLLLAQLRVDRIDEPTGNVAVGRWEPFVSAGRIRVGRPVLFRLTGDVALITSPVRTIEWMGPAQEISFADRNALRAIGNHLHWPRPQRRWWRRD
jgi:hypothetical protein